MSIPVFNVRDLVDPRQLFQINPGSDLDLIGEECAALLLDAPDMKLCQHKNRLMQRITLDGVPYLKVLKIIHIRLLLSRLARFEKWNAKRERYEVIDPPASIASVILKFYHYYPEYKEPEGGAA
jgi:hypothetical protein